MKIFFNPAIANNYQIKNFSQQKNADFVVKKDVSLKLKENKNKINR